MSTCLRSSLSGVNIGGLLLRLTKHGVAGTKLQLDHASTRNASTAFACCAPASWRAMLVTAAPGLALAIFLCCSSVFFAKLASSVRALVTELLSFWTADLVSVISSWMAAFGLVDRAMTASRSSLLQASDAARLLSHVDEFLGTKTLLRYAVIKTLGSLLLNYRLFVV